MLCVTESALYDTAYIAAKLGLVCNSVDIAKNITNKFYVRNATKDLKIINTPGYTLTDTAI